MHYRTTRIENGNRSYVRSALMLRLIVETGDGDHRNATDIWSANTKDPLAIRKIWPSKLVGLRDGLVMHRQRNVTKYFIAIGDFDFVEGR